MIFRIPVATGELSRIESRSRGTGAAWKVMVEEHSRHRVMRVTETVGDLHWGSKVLSRMAKGGETSGSYSVIRRQASCGRYGR